MKFYKHQTDLIEAKPKKTLLCWDTGTGKTLGSLALVYLGHSIDDVLVICPKAVKEKWVRDGDAFLKEAFAGEAIRKGTVVIRKPHVITKEEFRRDAKKLDKYRALIIDEAHYFGGMKSQMHKAMLWYIQQHSPDVVVADTATPYLSTPWNIYAIAKILGHNWSWIAFKSKFFDERWIGNRTIPVVKPGIEGEIAALVSGIGSVVDISACGDVPPQVDETELFTLTKEQEKAKERIKLEETNPVVKYGKYHQIDQGVLKGNEYVPHAVFETGKTEYLMELAENNRKLAIVARYTLQIQELERRLLAAGKKVFVISGKTKNNGATAKAADAADEGVVLIQAAVSEGYELPSFGVIAFASLDLSYKNYKQVRGRFLRGNALKKNVFIHLITKDSVDEAWFASIMRKQDFSLAIYAKEQGEVVDLEDETGSVLPDEI